MGCSFLGHSGRGFRVAVGYYLQKARLVALVHSVAVPVELTVFAVILLNEFPDYAADLATGKRNLVVRPGPRRASILYALVSMGSWIAVLLSVCHGVPARVLWFYLPVLVLSMALVVMVLSDRWQDRFVLERLCGANLAVNLGTTAALVLAFVV
ncbi:MAG: UbiA family prenyltransferase [Anaerolineae bacterium]|nr:UbiA family prenyltransferase [Anaerolineae bacterium]